MVTFEICPVISLLVVLVFYALLALQFGPCLLYHDDVSTFHVPWNACIDRMPPSTFAKRRGGKFCLSRRLVNFVQSEG